MGQDNETFVAEAEGAALGTYYMRPNQAGGGNLARARGYRAMQFNFVVSTK